MKKYVMALDQGTTSSRCILFEHNGAIKAKAQKEFRQIYPKGGWVEHNPEDIWNSQISVVLEVLKNNKIDPSEIDSIGITNQRETTIVWDKISGKPIYNAIVWQCRRSGEYCESLKAKGLEEKIYEKTGLVLDAYFSATKLKWILDNVDGAREKADKGELCFGTVDTFLLYRLTKGKVFATDHTNACRTMLYNIHTLNWDEELLELFDIPKSILPEVHPSSHHYGVTDIEILGKEVPICGIVGDQQGALFGQLCVAKGNVKNTYGTGCFMLMHTGSEAVYSKRGLITTIAATVDNTPQYALEGSVFVGGAVVQWLRDEMKMISNAAESELFAVMVSDTNGVHIIPAFVGLGAPHWHSNARGVVFGLTRGTKKEHFIRAALESIAYQVFDVLHAMERDSNIEIKTLAVDGGASSNNFLMQFQSDIANVNVQRPSIVETTALGACYLSGLKSGFWKNLKEIEEIAVKERVFTPTFDEDKRKGMIMEWEECVFALKQKR